MRIFFAIMFLCLAAFSLHVSASEIDDCLTSYDTCDQSNSMTVTADQILLTKNGMFVCIDHEVIPIKSIYMDNGLYKCLHFPDFHMCLGMCVWCSEVFQAGVQKCPNPTCNSNLYPNRYPFSYKLLKVCTH